MNFYELLILAKSGDDLANEKILAMYQPLLTKESVIDGVWDEDLYQELCIQLFLCLVHILNIVIKNVITFLKQLINPD